MRLLCVNNRSGGGLSGHDLTVGKIYEGKQSHESDKYVFLNGRTYFKWRFKIVKFKYYVENTRTDVLSG